MKKFFCVIFIVLFVFVFSGCAKLRHLPQLLTLKAYAKNKEEQEAYVLVQKKQFEKLLEVVNSGRLEDYQTKDQFVEAFGEPIVAHSKTRNGIVYDMWMYRFAGSVRAAEKIYLYFDEEGQLQDWEHYYPKNWVSPTKYYGGRG